MSGVEIAGTIASHLSSAQHSPGSPPINAESYSIHHLIQRPIWVFPLATSPKVCSLPCRIIRKTVLLNSVFPSRPIKLRHSFRWTSAHTTSRTGHSPW